DLIVGEKEGPWAAVVVGNATQAPTTSLGLRASLDDAEPVQTFLPPIPPLSVRKVGFRLPPAPPNGTAGALKVKLELVRLPRLEIKLGRGVPARRARRPEQSHKRPFVSDIDGSVQYYAVQPAKADEGAPPQALVLSLHGASVEALGQADAYLPKTWAHVV